jgi:hypothetical protein
MPNNEIRTARLLFILTTNHQVIIKELNTESVSEILKLKAFRWLYSDMIRLRHYPFLFFICQDIFRKTLKGTTDFHNDGMFSIQLGTQKVALIFSDFDTGTNIVWIVYSNWRYNEYICKKHVTNECKRWLITTFRDNSSGSRVLANYYRNDSIRHRC